MMGDGGAVDLNAVRSAVEGDLPYDTKLQVLQSLNMQAMEHTTQATNMQYLAELVQLDMQGKVERS